MTELEEKIQRAVDKVMESKKTEIEPQHIIKDGDYIWYKGHKYKREKSFYDKLWEMVSKKVGDNTEADELTDWIVDLIREHLPKEQSAKGSQNAYVESAVDGFNDCLGKVKGELLG